MKCPDSHKRPASLVAILLAFGPSIFILSAALIDWRTKFHSPFWLSIQLLGLVGLVVARRLFIRRVHKA
jgi:hypothetical protein